MMNRYALFLLLAVASGCSTEARYQAITEDVDAPGAELTVIQPDGVTSTHVAGVARGDEPVTPDQPFLIGSNTKMLTTAVVLQLVDEGRITLDESASPYVPALQASISVRNLLQHTSGLGEYFENDVFDEETGAGYDQAWTPDELLELGMEVSDTGPTDVVNYANTNFIAAGMLVEAVEGQPFGDVLHERILEPLKMTGSGLLEDMDEAPSNLVWGEAGALGTITRYHPSVGWAAGSAYATSADFARFMSAMFSAELYSSDLLSEQLERGDWDEYDSDQMESSYGLGTMIVDVDGGVILGHLGGLDGFGSAAMYQQDTGAIAVMLTNRSLANQGDENVAVQTVEALQLASEQTPDR
jgi:D-alanyl-D-alanine carboxypeptidase